MTDRFRKILLATVVIGFMGEACGAYLINANSPAMGWACIITSGLAAGQAIAGLLGLWAFGGDE